MVLALVEVLVEVVMVAAMVVGVWCRRRRPRGSEDWLNGIGEPDRRRLADSRTMPSRAPHGRATVVIGVVRVFVRPSLCFRSFCNQNANTIHHLTNIK